MPFYGFFRTALLTTWTKQMSLSDHIIHLFCYQMVKYRVKYTQEAQTVEGKDNQVFHVSVPCFLRRLRSL